MNLHRAVALLLSPTTVAFIAVLGSFTIEMNSTYLLISLVLLVVCPVLRITLLAIRGKIDVLVPDRFSRRPFFMQAITCYSLASVLLWMMGSRVHLGLALSYLLVTIFIALINQRLTKVSVHMAGIFGPAVFLLIAGCLSVGTVLMVLVPFLAWSRWRSGSHTLGQILLGVIISGTLTFAVSSLVL